MKRILSIILLFPFALNAMQEQEKQTSGEKYLANISPMYCAEIIDNNKEQYRQNGETEDGQRFGDYVVKATWTFDNIAKLAAVSYTVKKGAATLVQDTRNVTYDTARLRRVDAESHLRLTVDTSTAPRYRNITEIVDQE
jgi:hypothetical protein